MEAFRPYRYVRACSLALAFWGAPLSGIPCQHVATKVYCAGQQSQLGVRKTIFFVTTVQNTFCLLMASIGSRPCDPCP